MPNRLAERIELLRGELIRNPVIASFRFLQVYIAEGVAFYRVRATLSNSDMLQLVERFEYDAQELSISKYSYHWQRQNGSLICRWDNAPHHPEISTFPHHIHDSDETNVLPHESIDVFMVIHLIEERLYRA